MLEESGFLALQSAFSMAPTDAYDRSLQAKPIFVSCHAPALLGKNALGADGPARYGIHQHRTPKEHDTLLPRCCLCA